MPTWMIVAGLVVLLVMVLLCIGMVVDVLRMFDEIDRWKEGD